MKTIVTLSIFLLATAFYFWLSVGKYLSYNAYALDLGLFAQSSWLISHYRVPFSTLINRNQFADHFSPVYILLSLGYRFFNSPVYLLIVQTFSVVLGGVPIYILSKRIFKTWIVSALLTVSYFLQVGLVSAINFDFHLSTLSVGFISWTLYFWYRKKAWPYLALLVLSLLVKEDVSILFVFFSLYLLATKRVRLAVVTFVLSLFWYISYTRFIIPFFLGSGYYLDRVATMTILNGFDVKIVTIAKTFGQNLALSLFSPLGWFFAIPNIFSRFLSESYNRWSTDWHYGANIAAPLFFSVIFTLSRFKNQRVVLWISFTILVATIYLGWPFIPKHYSSQINISSINRAIKSVPGGASVSAQDIFVPHLANRQRIYLYPVTNDADYIILAPGLPSYPVAGDLLSEQVKGMLRDRIYEIQDFDGVYLFKRRLVTLN